MTVRAQAIHVVAKVRSIGTRRECTFCVSKKRNCSTFHVGRFKLPIRIIFIDRDLQFISFSCKIISSDEQYSPYSIIDVTSRPRNSTNWMSFFYQSDYQNHDVFFLNRKRPSRSFSVSIYTGSCESQDIDLRWTRGRCILR